MPTIQDMAGMACGWTWVSAAMVLVGGLACGHAGPGTGGARVAAVGRTTRPYQALPAYLDPNAARSEEGPVGRYAQNVPVAGAAARPTPEQRGAIRQALARVDLALAAVREQDAAGRQPVAGADPEEQLRLTADEVARLVAPRPDLVAEATELQQIARRLCTSSGLERDRLLARVAALTDLIRVQLAAT